MAIDPSAIIAETARIDPSAEIAAHVHVGEYCIVDRDVRIGPHSKLDHHVVVRRWTTLGESNLISSGCVLGSDPLDKVFDGRRSYLLIGDRNIIREHFTISRGTKPESVTQMGSGNFVMTSGHIAHDCHIGDNCVIASCALVAGYVLVEDGAFISGGVVVHQHSRVGRLAMVGGNSRVNLDLPPYFLYSGFDAGAVGLNLVGLKRAGFGPRLIGELKHAYRLLYRSRLKLAVALNRITEECTAEATGELVAFIRQSRRGIARERAHLAGPTES